MHRKSISGRWRHPCSALHGNLRGDIHSFIESSSAKGRSNFTWGLIKSSFTWDDHWGKPRKGRSLSRKMGKVANGPLAVNGILSTLTSTWVCQKQPKKATLVHEPRHRMLTAGWSSRHIAVTPLPVASDFLDPTSASRKKSPGGCPLVLI